MDVFLTRLSQQATSYAIRSCIALTSTYVLQHGSRLLKAVDDHPLRAELAILQRRLARKIELISPILECIEFQYTRGNSALEQVVRTTRQIREDINALGRRLEAAAVQGEPVNDGTGRRAVTVANMHVELVAILADMKDLLESIDDTIPIIHLWVSAMGGVKETATAFSPSRLLQASVLLNVGDMQYIIDPRRPMQIGPDFTLSLYMLFRGHASEHGGEPYGVEEGQRKPMWKEVIHKARVRVYRVPSDTDPSCTDDGNDSEQPAQPYRYQLQVVEDLDDGRHHDDGEGRPSSYDGVPDAGIRELIPVAQIAKMFYADVGRILNISKDDGATNPVLLLKRAVPEVQDAGGTISVVGEQQQHARRLIADTAEKQDYGEGNASDTESAISDTSSQHNIDQQLREESQMREISNGVSADAEPAATEPGHGGASRVTLPSDLDPEWIALEVFECGEADSSTTDGDEVVPEDDLPYSPRLPRAQSPHANTTSSADSNLVTQLQRMRVASTHPSSSFSSPASSSTQPPSDDGDRRRHGRQPSATLIDRSPFSAIKTSLSLLEMLLRLSSLQEFEQATHLSIPDRVLTFYLDGSASESGGLHGQARAAARAEASRKVGFNPYVDKS